MEKVCFLAISTVAQGVDYYWGDGGAAGAGYGACCHARFRNGASGRGGRLNRCTLRKTGSFKRWFCRKAEKVAQGTPLLQMADLEQRAAAASVVARYKTAMAQTAQALVDNDAPLAGQRQVEGEYLRGEMNRLAEQVERTTIRAAISGVVTTPHVDTYGAQSHCRRSDDPDRGDPTGQSSTSAVPERDVTVWRGGHLVSIKLESFPTRTYRGTVSVVSPAAGVVGDDRVFYARIAVPNSDGSLRPGMQGFGKVWAGLWPLGYVISAI